MGSYMYNKLKEVLGGVNFASGKVFSGWSPNEVRAVYIMHDFILVADYIKAPKIVQLDPVEVAKDLESPSVRGSLNNLLSTRQLSCMEEVYVDEVFTMKASLINLPAYVASLVSGKSRLRYWGYVSNVDANMIMSAYTRAITEGVLDFTLAQNVGGFHYNDTGNDDWYRKYLLRPQYYSVDKDDGKLAIWFRKVEKQKTAEIEAIEAKRKEYGFYGDLVAAFDKDVHNFKYIARLLRIRNAGSQIDRYAKKAVLSLLTNALKAAPRYKGITQQTLLTALQTVKYPRPACAESLMRLYQNLHYYDRGSDDKSLKPLTSDSRAVQAGVIGYEDLVIAVIRGFLVDRKAKLTAKVSLNRYFSDDEIVAADEVLFNSGKTRGFAASSWDGVLHDLLGMTPEQVKILSEGGSLT